MLEYIALMFIYTLAFLEGALAGELALIYFRDLILSCGNCGAFPKSWEHPGIARFFFKMGKCKICGKMEDIQPVIIQFLSGMALVLLFYRYGASFESLATFLITSILFIVFLEGISERVVSDKLLLWLFGIGLATAVYIRFDYVSYVSDRVWWNQPVGALGTAVFLIILSLIGSLMSGKDSSIGMGDIKLFTAIGFCLGWRLALISVFLSILLAGIAGGTVLLAKSRHGNGSETIPFSPFIAVAVIYVLYMGQDIIFWFTGII
jgi:prepilin signal peptidase PulO-like enzyme (type II secretory pathway)